MRGVGHGARGPGKEWAWRSAKASQFFMAYLLRLLVVDV